MLGTLCAAVRSRVAHSCDVLKRGEKGTDVPDVPVQHLELTSLPAEVQIEILASVPGAALSIMDTSHRMEQLVAHDLLGPLLRSCSGSIQRLREFIGTARRAGRTPEQIFSLSAALGENHPAALGMEFVRLGLLTPRSFNALSDTVIGMLARADVLLYAIARSEPLLSDPDLSAPEILAGAEPPPLFCGRALVFSKTTIYYSEFHMLVRRIAISTGEEGVLQCRAAQYRHSRELARRLIVPPDCRQVDVQAMAAGDAYTLGRVMRMFLSAEALTAVEGKVATWHGALYQRKAGRYGVSAGEGMQMQVKPARASSSCVVL